MQAPLLWSKALIFPSPKLPTRQIPAELAEVGRCHCYFVKSFTDPNVPAGQSPYNVQNINSQLFVIYGKFGMAGGQLTTSSQVATQRRSAQLSTPQPPLFDRRWELRIFCDGATDMDVTALTL